MLYIPKLQRKKRKGPRAKAMGTKVRVPTGKELTYEQSQNPIFIPDIHGRARWAAAATQEIEGLIERSELLRFIDPADLPANRSAVSLRRWPTCPPPATPPAGSPNSTAVDPPRAGRLV